VKLQEDMKHNSAQLKKSQASLTKESKKQEESASAIARLQSQLQSGRRSVEEITAKKAEEEAKIEEIMASLQDATKSLREKLEVAQIHLADAERRVASFQSEKEVVSTRIQLLKSRADAAASGVQSIQQKLESLEQDRTAARRCIQELEAEGKELNRLIIAGEKQRTTLHEQETTIQGKLRQAREDVEDLRARQATQGKNGATGVVAAIMKACGPKGPLAKAGVHGRLGDLATIDPEFDVAISTACGMLDNIVVETTEGAQMCLSFLKENNLGRATFILLDQMTEWKTRMVTAFRVPTGTYRLFDVIVPFKEAYLPAFYMALKDTLVANDLDAATAIAYVGDRAVHRVVTRTGDLIDTSGAMSGGGKEAKSGGMKLKSGANPSRAQSREDDITPELIKSYEDKVEALSAELQKCRSDREMNEVSLKEMKTRVKSCVTDIDKQSAIIASLMEQESDLQSRLQRIAAETQLTPEEHREIADLEKQFERLDAEMNRAAPDLRSHKLEVSNIQQQIRDVGGPRLGKAQARLDLLSTQFDKLTKDLSSYEVEESNHSKQASKAQAACEKLEKEVLKFESKLKELVKEQQDMEHDALLVAEAVEAAKAKMVDTEQQLGSIKVAFDKMKTDVKKIEEVEVDLQNELEKSNKDLHEHMNTAAGWKKKLDAVRKAHVDEQVDFQTSIESAIGSASAVVKEVLAKEIETLPDLSEEMLETAIEEVETLKKELSILEAEKQR
jgi:structural maintenance of chromosome 4